MYTHSHARTRTHALTPNLLSPPSDGCGHHLGQRDRDPLSKSYHILIFPSPVFHLPAAGDESHRRSVGLSPTPDRMATTAEIGGGRDRCGREWTKSKHWTEGGRGARRRMNNIDWTEWKQTTWENFPAARKLRHSENCYCIRFLCNRNRIRGRRLV